MSDYNFSPELAIKIGVEEAIMVHNLVYWIRHNKANKTHFYENRYWTYNTVLAFTELFPFWTPKQLRRIMDSLYSQNVIIKGNFNKSSFDRTGWYSLTDNYNYLLVIYDMPKQANGDAEKDNTIPNSKQEDNKTSLSNDKELNMPDSVLNAKNIKKQKEKSSAKKGKHIGNANFYIFWDLYGYKVSREKAIEAWNRLSIFEQEEVIKILPNWKKYHNPKIDLPYPATFLNDKRWLDEFEPVETKVKSMYPSNYDKMFEAKLSMQQCQEYWKHLRSLGYSAKKDRVGNTIDWIKTA